MSEQRVSVATEQTFTESTAPQIVIDVLKTEGGLLLHDFISKDEQVAVTDEVLAHELKPVDRSNHTIAEQFQDTGWDYKDAPPQVAALGQRVLGLIQSALPDWSANKIRAQLYSPGEAGIEWHRDYSRDLRVIAVASFIGPALFEARLDNEEVRWTVEPGDLVLLRGSLLNGVVDDRPYHRVEAPETGQRLSVAYREVAAEPPALEGQKNERN